MWIQFCVNVESTAGVVANPGMLRVSLVYNMKQLLCQLAPHYAMYASIYYSVVPKYGIVLQSNYLLCL